MDTDISSARPASGGGAPATAMHVIAGVVTVLTAFLGFFWFLASQYADLKVQQALVSQNVAVLQKGQEKIEAALIEQGKEIRATYKMMDLGTQSDPGRRR